MAADDVVAARAETEAELAAKMEELAAWCDEQDLKELAARTRDWTRTREPGKLYFVDLSVPSEPTGPVEEAEPSGPAEAGDSPREPAEGNAAKWSKRFSALRREQAEKLFELARRAARNKQWSLAFDLVQETVRHDRDHAAARRLLGYERYRGAWHTPFESQMLRNGRVWHGLYGWLPKDDVARYEDGLRPFGKKWISIEEDARRHRTVESGWKVHTEHYTVTTNDSLEAGVRLGERLEELYRVWQTVFVRYYASDSQLARLFEGRTKPGQGMRRHNVVYFRNREEYEKALRGELPSGVYTSGIYLSSHRTAYFFAGDDAEDFSTLDHEATHQLFSETRRVVPDIGQEANFWIVEGIACYMESFQRRGEYHTLGGPDALRLENARSRLVDDDFYLPLAELSTWGMRHLQQDERIKQVYSQSAGLAHFLMHADDGRYRDALIEFLASVYSGKDQAGTLADLAGATFGGLDEKYRSWIAEVKVEAGK
jgi:hypothetical protein